MSAAGTPEAGIGSSRQAPPGCSALVVDGSGPGISAGRLPVRLAFHATEGESVATAPVNDGFELDVVLIGGCGRAGLPLAIAFADRGARVGIYDVSEAAVETVNAGRMPFAEPGAADALGLAVAAGRLKASADDA